MYQRETAARLGTTATASDIEQPYRIAKPTTKIATILLAFTRGVSLNRFDAERYHDHCLHSTVATLESNGIQIVRDWEKVPCVNGRAEARVKRYRLETSPRNIVAARNLLQHWRITP